MKILCITQTDLVFEAEKFLKTNYPTDDWTITTSTEVKKSPLLSLRIIFRFYGVLFFMVSDIKRCSYLDLVHSFLFCSFARRKIILDSQGGKLTSTLLIELQSIIRILIDAVCLPFALLYFKVKIKSRLQASGRNLKKQNSKEYSKVLYIRSDPWYELKAGGSVSHTDGVIKGLKKLNCEAVYMAPIPLKPLEKAGTKTLIVNPDITFLKNVPEMPFLIYNNKLVKAGEMLFNQNKFDFIYQRYGLFNFSGLSLAKEFSVPFVLEYNGSEIWINRNWGEPLVFESMAQQIEDSNLLLADLIVVVSRVLQDELVERGISKKKILVNPNGVDPDSFRPDIDGHAVRDKYNLAGKVVVGFLGTFGRWHGVEVLAAAIKQVISKNDNVHFLIVGDGMTMTEVREIIKRDSVEKHVTLTGLVPQLEAPDYLGACDIFVSPHVPNPDGTPFFGSPTKLFEYMAMEKGIVASDLDQIGDILKHKQTAWMVTPGDATDLANGIIKLVENRELNSELGKNARAEALEKYTWTEHVRKILFALKEA